MPIKIYKDCDTLAGGGGSYGRLHRRWAEEQETITLPETELVHSGTPVSPIMEDSGYGYQNCLGWKAGKKVWICLNDSSHTKEEVILVDVKLASEADGVTISGSSVTIDCKDLFEYKTVTFTMILIVLQKEMRSET